MCRVPLSWASLDMSEGKSTEDPHSSSAGIPMGRQKRNRHSKKIIRWEVTCARVMERAGDFTEKGPRSRDPEPSEPAKGTSREDPAGRRNSQWEGRMGRVGGASCHLRDPEDPEEQASAARSQRDGRGWGQSSCVADNGAAGGGLRSGTCLSRDCLSGVWTAAGWKPGAASDPSRPSPASGTLRLTNPRSEARLTSEAVLSRVTVVAGDSDPLEQRQG